MAELSPFEGHAVSAAYAMPTIGVRLAAPKIIMPPMMRRASIIMPPRPELNAEGAKTLRHDAIVQDR